MGSINLQSIIIQHPYMIVVQITLQLMEKIKMILLQILVIIQPNIFVEINNKITSHNNIR